MAKRKIAGPGRLGSVTAAKKSAKAGGNKFVKTIPAEGSLTVRFLEEPPDWYGYYEHYDKPLGGYFPCTGDDCPGCANPSEDGSRSFRYLANAYVVDDSKVMAVKMPKSLVEQLLAYHEKYHTSLDRDYDLTKTGSGKEGTKYMASPDSPTKMKLSRFTPLDLDDVLASLLGDDEDEETPKRSKKGASKSSSKKRRRDEEDDDDDDDDDDDPWDDDDDDDDEEEERPRKKKSSAKSKKSSGKKVVKKTVSKPVRKSTRKNR